MYTIDIFQVMAQFAPFAPLSRRLSCRNVTNGRYQTVVDSCQYI